MRFLPALPGVLFLAILTAPADADDSFGLRAGMSGEEAMAALEGRCSVKNIGPPYITCRNETQVITASISKSKNRLYYAKLVEPAGDAEAYGAGLAADMGFTGSRSDCAMSGKPTWCWTDADGTALHVKQELDDGKVTSYLTNERIRAEDGVD